MRKLLLIILLGGLAACNAEIKEKIGLVKHQPDEFQVVTNPPLSVPPDFNIYSPEELATRKKDSTSALQQKGNLSKGENQILQSINK